MTTNNSNRRGFLEMAGSAAVAFSVLPAKLVFGTQANAKIKLGLIGCGGRGTWIAGFFLQHGGYELAAAADYFPEKVAAVGDKFNIPQKNRFPGLLGYQRLLDARLVDAVAIESPPYFHPQQAAAAVAAGQHVYLAKPVAVDVPGCRSIAESGKRASANRLCFLVDFQTRANALFIEAINRVHQGAVGRFAFGEASYHAGNPFTQQQPFLEDDPKNPENRLRAWGLDRALSGDIITEQNIHTLDVASWIMNQDPVFAMGTCGHKVRTDKGTCNDHFAVLFQYPENVAISFTSRQFEGHGTLPEGIRNRMFGALGVLETQYGGQVLIRGKNFYRGGGTEQIYKEGAVNNIAAFHKSITEARFDNLTVTPSVQSNLVTILGRTAAYEGKQVFWDQLIKSDAILEPNLKGLKE